MLLPGFEWDWNNNSALMLQDELERYKPPLGERSRFNSLRLHLAEMEPEAFSLLYTKARARALEARKKGRNG